MANPVINRLALLCRPKISPKFRFLLTHKLPHLAHRRLCHSVFSPESTHP